MTFAREIDGTFIGHRIRMYNGDVFRDTEEITMVLHKKNRRVQIRYGKNNRQVELDPGNRVWRIPNGSEI